VVEIQDFLRVIVAESRVVRVVSTVSDDCWAIGDDSSQMGRAGAVVSGVAASKHKGGSWGK